MIVLLALLPVASASPIYPDTLAGDAGMPCTPSCIVCHSGATGSAGTATQPFALAMKDRGLTGGSATDLVASALDAMATDGVDSDQDGTPDVDELAAGDDPNGGAPLCGTDQVLTPSYGCAAHVSVAPEGARWSWLAILAAGLAFTRRRR